MSVYISVCYVGTLQLQLLPSNNSSNGNQAAALVVPVQQAFTSAAPTTLCSNVRVPQQQHVMADKQLQLTLAKAATSNQVRKLSMLLL